MKVKDLKVGKVYILNSPPHTKIALMERAASYRNNEYCGAISYNETAICLDYKKVKGTWRGEEIFYHCTKFLTSSSILGWLVQTTRSYRLFSPIEGDDIGQ